MNLRLTLEYDGTAYAGWQLQENAPSIQGALLAALERVTGQRPKVSVAGRTDAGVHALGQVVSFHTDSQLPAWQFAPALNAHLPADISVMRSELVPDEFDARHDSISKVYRYSVRIAPQRSPLWRQRAWHRRRPLDVALMQEAAQHLIGDHDFESFRSAHCDAAHARRTMHDITISERLEDDACVVHLVFHANAFCRHMCRILAGTLVEMGHHKRTVDGMLAAKAARDRQLVGVTAPAMGLTLLRVHYPA